MNRLSTLAYQNQARAKREIAALAPHLPMAVQSRFDLLLAASPAAEQGLYYFTQLRERHPEVFDELIQSPAGLRHLVAVFTYSKFLSEAVLEHPDWAEDVLNSPDLERVLTEDELRARLLASLPPGVPPPIAFARFRRQQLLRIVTRDALGLGTIAEITGELSLLADTLVDVAYERIRQDLIGQHGSPNSAKGEAQFAVIALGKLGGEELNYSSDIDLMFVFSGNGQTNGAVSITNKEFFKRAANQLSGLLCAYTAEGICYRVDLRLRPDGRMGEVCLPVEAAQQYYSSRARDWELQMLIKARVAAGHRPTGRALLDFVEPRSYSTTLDFSAVEALSVTRERLNEKLAGRPVKKKENTIDVKLDRGGIRDIEFLVQCLQRLHGGSTPWVQHRGTLLALARLEGTGLLSDSEYGRLASAYQFLRHLEHRLQFDEDRQTHALPDNIESLELIARRMPGGGTAESLLRNLRGHFAEVSEIYERVVHARHKTPDVGTPSPERPEPLVIQALEQRAPELAAALARAGLQRGHRSFEYFLERIAHDPGRLDRLDRNPALTHAALDLFEHSPYFAEELIRRPESIDELSHAAIPLARDETPPYDVAQLRRWYRRDILRIEADSICRSVPIFETLDRTSDLADTVISRVYDIAVVDVQESHGCENPGYRPSDQMWVIALGRLGLREFDLGSDADLMFVLPDSDVAELVFWTRVAERIVQLIAAYTGEGVLFTVDMRLRPNGAAGPLVQTESAVKDYFARTAEAWEGIYYMKSRVAGGDAKRAQQFLHELQQVDWKRYGQNGRSRSDLREMRMRLEREQGGSHPLKAGPGGYYDIDFLLMYLRLRSAGVFFTVLNTPARIEVLENMQQLSRTDAQFLCDAATFYRALDHGIRVISGHAEGNLPKAETQLEALRAVLPRWTPVPLSDLAKVRSETRALFDSFFR